ncbi:MAG: PAS domain-containing hybrid sensor histidine kinase/response regulator [Pseudomonadota bacterium]
MPIWLILGVTALYALGLFAIAWRRDQKAAAGSLSQSPTVYALALGVYCTSWTYFGAVGTATSSGWEYLPIYLGPILVFLFLPSIIRRIGDVAQKESITSLSDFLAARYGKSRGVGVLVTIAATAGSLPYIALQLKSVGMSFEALANDPVSSVETSGETILIAAIALALFAVLFGTRHSDTTRHNPGLMRLLAFESIVKLVALVAVAIVSVLALPTIDSTRSAAISAPFTGLDLSARLITITLLSMAAIICLPRQFHVAITERRSENDLKRARWLFPLYLGITSLVVVPISIAGAGLLPAGVPADLYVLGLPLHLDAPALALFVFLGGLSAASGMVIVSAIALSTMVTNDVLVPGLMRIGRFSSVSGDAGARLVTLRRWVIVAIMVLAYGYTRVAGSEALAQIGLLSFAAAAQFAPALIGAVIWRGGKALGALAGIGLGMTVWTYCLFLPSIIGIETMQAIMPAFLDPYGLFGSQFGDPLTHGVVWSLFVNLASFVAVSLRQPERLRDRIQSAAFTGDRTGRMPEQVPMVQQAQGISPNGLKTLASRFLSPEAVDHAFARMAAETGVTIGGDEPADWRLVQRTERLLASALGASSARVVMASAIGGVDVAFGDLLEILDHRTQAERFDRHMLQSMLENVSQGISVVDGEQRLVAWNSAYIDLFGYPPDLLRIGMPIGRLIEHNISRGWVEDADPEEEIQRRLRHMREGKPHYFERPIEGGRFLRIVGNPMPGGGYVTTFTDITEDKRREQALVEANETLEARVRERTAELEDMAEDRDAARQEAEGANASKTRFLAAASHDLLQPLNAARLFLGAINPQDDRATDLITKTDRAIQSADGLLKGLLDISRLDHGNIAPKPVNLPLNPLFEDLVDEAAPMANAAGLRIVMVPTRHAVLADPHFLESILRNFISNARRYTEKGGVVIGARRRGDQVRLEVWDTGPGIPPEQQTKLFDEFQRLADTDNAGIRGAGLGLSVAKRMADLMGADIDVRSVSGRGSVFAVTLPLANNDHRTASVTSLHVSRSVGEPLHGLRVLCIDDEKTIREGMKALLESWGCTVSLADGPQAAFAVAAACNPSVVIADQQLETDLQGTDVLTSLRSGARRPVVCALLTASTAPEVTERAAALGITVFRKPANPDLLRAFLERAALTTAEAAE